MSENAKKAVEKLIEAVENLQTAIACRYRVDEDVFRGRSSKALEAAKELLLKEKEDEE